MEKVITGLPELDSHLGPLEGGMLVLVEGEEEAYPTTLLHIICYNIAMQGVKISYIIVGDLYQDYKESISRLGYGVSALEERGMWKYYEYEDVNEAWREALRQCSEGGVVVVDSAYPPPVDVKCMRSIIGGNCLVIVRVNPELCNVEELVKLERLAHLLVRLYVDRQGRRLGRILEVTKFKRGLKSDIYLTYVVSETGISMERLTRVG